jgi:DNA-binding transcriptional ArsR family regulator
MIFSALADGTRRQLLTMLAEQPQSASGLSRQVDISRQAVAKHLSLLEAANLIAPHRAGREIQFRVQPGSLGATLEWMEKTTMVWEQRLDRLESELD